VVLVAPLVAFGLGLRILAAGPAAFDTTPIAALVGQLNVELGPGLARRFAEYHDLEGAFGRRAVTERAKGILMERHSIDANAAVDGHALLPNQVG
jgi:hypothetical protein